MHRICFALVSVVIFSACSVDRAKPGSIADVVQASVHGLEVEATPEDLAREEVLAMPTDFDITLEQDRFAWERARFFLENYSADGVEHGNPVVKVVGSRRGLGSAPTVSSYSYEVFKDFYAGGYRYSVRCVPGPQGESRQAMLNAGNFARFIRDGKLEVSLLPRISG